MKKIIFMLFFIFVLTIDAFASDSSMNMATQEISDELLNFKNSLPKDVLNLFPEEIWSGDFSKLLSNEFDEKSFLNIILDYIFLDIKNILNSFSNILIIIIITSIFNMLSKSFFQSLTKEAYSMASSLFIALVVFKICISLTSTVTSYMKTICNVMQTISPLMTTLYIMTGNITTATVTNASLALLISIIESFLLVFMLPIVNISICFSSINCLGGVDFSGISKLLKTCFSSITVFVMSILMFILSFKSTLSQSSDSISIKTAKFAISSFIPIVGSSLNDALRTITSSLSYIKNACGTLAIMSILILILPIILRLLLYRLSFSILSSTTRALGGTNETVIIDEANSICGFLLSLIICTGILFIFILTILIKTTVVL